MAIVSNEVSTEEELVALGKCRGQPISNSGIARNEYQEMHMAEVDEAADGQPCDWNDQRRIMYWGAKTNKELRFLDTSAGVNVDPMEIWGLSRIRSVDDLLESLNGSVVVALRWTMGSSEPRSSRLASRMAQVHTRGGALNHGLRLVACLLQLGSKISVLRS